MLPADLDTTREASEFRPGYKERSAAFSVIGSVLDDGRFLTS